MDYLRVYQLPLARFGCDYKQSESKAFFTVLAEQIDTGYSYVK